MKELLTYAGSENKAVGAFSVGNLEMVMGAVKAAEELNSPIILQIAQVRLKNSPLQLMAPMMVSAAKEANVPIAVHFDHGLDLQTVEKTLSYGFTSVMIDGSQLTFEENIALTNKTKSAAMKYGATVESELGIVGGNEGEGKKHEISCTDPEKALEFCQRTKTDALAVAVGNAHGNYPVLPQLRFDVLEKIHNITDTPLVLHGGTGITPEMFRKAITLGVRKINIATASFDCLAVAAKKYCENTDKLSYFGLSEAETEGVFDNVKKHILIFNNN